MNAYYHEFTPALFYTHLYFWVFLAMTLIMAGIGTRQWRRQRREIVRQFEDKFLGIVAVVFAVIVASMFVAESHDGILQHGMNGAVGYEDPLLSGSAALIGFWLMALTVSAVVFFFVGRVAGDAKHGRLNIRLIEDRADEEAKEARRRQKRQAAQAGKPVREKRNTGYYPARAARRDQSRYQRAKRRQTRMRK